MTHNPVPLVRQFLLLSEKPDDDLNKNERDLFFRYQKYYQKHYGWEEIEKEFRCVILAEAGAGKSFEMRARAKHIEGQGHKAFFIRIEHIKDDFESAFEVGDEDNFKNWLNSEDESWAWFFLDSVDESRLKDPRDFEKAIMHFARQIKPAQHRARVFISSRPYTWRPDWDRGLVKKYLPLESPTPEERGNSEKKVVDSESTKQENDLRIFSLEPLDEDSIRIFAEHHGTPDIDGLVNELHRTNMMLLAERPLDLESILATWRPGQTLDGRLEMLRYYINIHLEENDPDRDEIQSINHEKARRGAQLLAVAVVLTGEQGISVPDSPRLKKGIDANVVLDDWDQKDVRALLERGLFNGALFRTVRFPHPVVQDLLAAEWFCDQLTHSDSRYAIESLFFVERYGRSIITPRLRPVISWLILFDDEIRRRAIEITPEVAIEEGDAARLALAGRRKILHAIVDLIAGDKDDNIFYDNRAVIRIAQPDLEDDVLRLITDNKENDRVIIFLSRLAKHAQMKTLVPVLSEVAVNPDNGISARINATHTVITCGKPQEIRQLCRELLTSSDKLPCDLLAVVMDNPRPDMDSVNFLLESINKLPPLSYDEGTMALGKPMRDFIDRLQTAGEQNSLKVMVDGLNEYLNRKPYMDEGHVDVSKEFSWLLSPVAHAVEHLVSTHSHAALSQEALAIMIKVPEAKSWSNEYYDEYKNRLHEIVPVWNELNDALFWKTVEKERDKPNANRSERLTDVMSVISHKHYWGFGIERFDDVLGFIPTRNLLDDKLVAFSLAYRIFWEAGAPANWLSDLKRVAEENSNLKEHLDTLLKQSKDRDALTLERQEASKKEDLRIKKEDLSIQKKREEYHRNWVKCLKESPDIVRHPPGLKPEEASQDQIFLLRALENVDGMITNLSHVANWEMLIPEFGEEVAKAYRDAAVAYWREFTPIDPRLKTKENNTIQSSLIFGMAGLEIESREVDDFPSNLRETEVRHALRYILWELNNFPGWLEQLHQAYPKIVLDAVLAELDWEINCRESGQEVHHILQKLTSAEWIHLSLAPVMLDWINKNKILNDNILRDYLYILRNGKANAKTVLNLAQSKITENTTPSEQLSTWYALWIDTDAEQGIPASKKWLSSLSEEKAVMEAQLLVTKVNGTGRSFGAKDGYSEPLNVKHLKDLYVLMHQYIRKEDDIDHPPGKAYSPGLRDNAQRSRENLLFLISETPGKDTYTVLVDLAKNHPCAKYRPWMEKLAQERAEKDADLELLWSAEQVLEYSKNQAITPNTHRQLFDLTVNRLVDMKTWVERGNDSPYRTWQTVGEETEIRNLVAGWLSETSSGRFTCAQENELANRQRTDISIQHPNVSSAVPIEIKLPDKWSGRGLCEGMCNQLAQDYLKEEAARHGIFLLVWQGSSTANRKWEINGNRVTLPDLPAALAEHWESVSGAFPGVGAIKIILIDTTVRGEKSTS